MNAPHYGSEYKRLSAKYQHESAGPPLRGTIGLFPELPKRADEKIAAESKDEAEQGRCGCKYGRYRNGLAIQLLLDGVDRLILNSPVGAGLDYKAALVDGESLFDKLAEKVKFMRLAEFNVALKSANEICKTLSRFIKDH